MRTTTETETRAPAGARSDAATTMAHSSAAGRAVPSPVAPVIAIPRPAQLRHHREGALPPELTDPSARRWITWGDGKGPGPDGKLNKKPHAESNQPDRWVPYGEAVATAKRTGASGVGLQLLDAKKILVLDLDHMVKGRGAAGDVKLTARGERLLAAVGPEVYVEVSPSGNGLRVIARRPEDLDLAGDTLHKFKDGEGLEIYSGASGRYATVTGDALPGRGGRPLAPLPLAAIAALEAEGAILKRPGSAGTGAAPAPAVERDPGWRGKVVNLLSDADLRLLDEGAHGEKYASRSEHLAGVVTRLTRSGMAPEGIFTVLVSADGAWQCALDHREGDAKDAVDFLWRQVQRVTEWNATTEHALEHELGDWLENIVLVEDGGRVADLRRPGTARVTKWEDWRRANANQYVHVASKDGMRKQPKVKLWLEHPQRKTARVPTWDPRAGALVEKVVMRADGTEERVLFVNTFEPKHHRRDLVDPALLEVFREQVRHMYGEDAGLLEQFFAHRVQFPGERPPIAMLSIAREQGTGRGWLNVVLGGVLGEQNVKKVAPKDLEGNFNGWAVEALDIFVEEVAPEDAKKRWEMNADLRDLITARYGEVNRKFGTQKQEQFFASIRLETNHRNAVKVTEEDRRLMVLEVVSPLRPNEHYARLYEFALGERRDALFASVYYHLAGLDLTGFRAMNRAPMNKAKRALIGATSTDVEKLVVEFIETCPAKAVMPATVDAWLRAHDVETFSHEAEIRAVLQKRMGGKPYEERSRRVRDPADPRAKKERRKVAPWILHSRDRDLGFTELQVEVEKAHRWAVEAPSRPDLEGEDDPLG